MSFQELQAQISLGEDSKHQFKVDVRNADSLDSEMAAFANCEGGTIYLGVADDGSAPGLDKNDIARINQLIKAGIDKLDKLRFRDFLRDVYKQDYPDDLEELTRLLQNMNLATDDRKMNLAGVLMFAEQPELIKPQFVLKASAIPATGFMRLIMLIRKTLPGHCRKFSITPSLL